MALLRLYAAAENMCVISSLLSTCRNHDVNPREYLNDIISRMPYMEKASHEQLVELLPHKWKLIPHEPAVTLPTDGKPFVTKVYRQHYYNLQVQQKQQRQILQVRCLSLLLYMIGTATCSLSNGYCQGVLHHQASLEARPQIRPLIHTMDSIILKKMASTRCARGYMARNDEFPHSKNLIGGCQFLLSAKHVFVSNYTVFGERQAPS